MALPSGYRRLDYIEGTGTQWIDTGVTATEKTKSQLRFNPLEVTGAVIYGLTIGNDSTDYRLFNYNSQIYFDFSSSRINGSSMPVNAIYEIELGNYYVKNMLTNTILLSGTTINSYTSPRTITWLRDSNGSGATAKARLHYLKIFDNETLIRDFVPALRVSDSKPGLYDLVTNTFYTNSGTGEFTYGSVVSDTPNIFFEDNPLVIDVGGEALLTANLERAASLRYKVNGVWKYAIPYIKLNGNWYKAIAYRKTNGVWKQGI